MVMHRRYFGGILSGFAILTIIALGAFASHWSTPLTDSPSYRLSYERIYDMPPIKFIDAHSVMPAEVDGSDWSMAPAETERMYSSIKQPGQNWRFAVDTYRHIDPGRRLAI